MNGPDGKTWQWTGERAPALKRSKPPKWGKPINLFNGKDLTGWKMSEPNPEKVWKVENGELIASDRPTTIAASQDPRVRRLLDAMPAVPRA